MIRTISLLDCRTLLVRSFVAPSQVPRLPTVRRALVITAAGALLLAPALSAHATPSEEVAGPPPVGLAVATELARIGGVGTQFDDSSSTQCIFGADPEPLTYSTREIVLRANLSKGQ